MEIQKLRKLRLFIAYPWNIYIQGMYEEIIGELFKEWDIRHGSKVSLEDKAASEVEEFLNKSKHLYDVFVSAIGSSDFFIADVTGAKPNVMLELGIAMQSNNNVLIVTSEDLRDLPFDISSFHVKKYKDKYELKEIIIKELQLYKSIKSQSFNKYFKEFYFAFPANGELKHGDLLMLPLPREIKNFRFRCEFKFIKESNSHDWLGVHLRVKQPPIFSSELVYSRFNEKLESVSFPGRRTPVVGTKKTDTSLISDDGFKTMEILIMENTLQAQTPDYILEDTKLIDENIGGVALHAWAHNPPTQHELLIQYRNIEVISLDTTSIF